MKNAHYGHDYGATSDASLRAADADRDATADRLRQHHLEGRIDVPEFQERLDRTYGAKTIGELRQLVSDLPPDLPRDRQAEPFDRRPRLRPRWMFPLIPLLVVIIATSALDGHNHPGLWIVIPLFFLARFLFLGYRPWGWRREQGRHL